MSGNNGPRNYYAVLGVASDATADEIKQAYRRLARKYHPDLNRGDKVAEEKCRAVIEANEVLSDTKQRRLYDLQQAGRYVTQAQATPRNTAWAKEYTKSPPHSNSNQRKKPPEPSSTQASSSPPFQQPSAQHVQREKTAVEAKRKQQEEAKWQALLAERAAVATQLLDVKEQLDDRIAAETVQITDKNQHLQALGHGSDYAQNSLAGLFTGLGKAAQDYAERIENYADPYDSLQRDNARQAALQTAAQAGLAEQWLKIHTVIRKQAGYEREWIANEALCSVQDKLGGRGIIHDVAKLIKEDQLVPVPLWQQPWHWVREKCLGHKNTPLARRARIKAAKQQLAVLAATLNSIPDLETLRSPSIRSLVLAEPDALAKEQEIIQNRMIENGCDISVAKANAKLAYEISAQQVIADYHQRGDKLGNHNVVAEALTPEQHAVVKAIDNNPDYVPAAADIQRSEVNGNTVKSVNLAIQQRTAQQKRDVAAATNRLDLKRRFVDVEINPSLVKLARTDNHAGYEALRQAELNAARQTLYQAAVTFLIAPEIDSNTSSAKAAPPPQSSSQNASPNKHSTTGARMNI